jgi:hypothetical protein
MVKKGGFSLNPFDWFRKTEEQPVASTIPAESPAAAAPMGGPYGGRKRKTRRGRKGSRKSRSGRKSNRS